MARIEADDGDDAVRLLLARFFFLTKGRKESRQSVRELHLFARGAAGAVALVVLR